MSQIRNLNHHFATGEPSGTKNAATNLRPFNMRLFSATRKGAEIRASTGFFSKNVYVSSEKRKITSKTSLGNSAEFPAVTLTFKNDL
jgi:hypothetical protein